MHDGIFIGGGPEPDQPARIGAEVRTSHFVAGELEQAATFAAALRHATLRSGAYAAGDLAHQAVYPMPPASVLNAASAGMLAGVAALQDLMAEDFDLTPVA